MFIVVLNSHTQGQNKKLTARGRGEIQYHLDLVFNDIFSQSPLEDIHSAAPDCLPLQKCQL